MCHRLNSCRKRRGEKKIALRTEQFQGRLSKLWNYCLGWWKNPAGGTDWTKPATWRWESHRDFVRAVRKHHGTSRATTISVRSLWKKEDEKEESVEEISRRFASAPDIQDAESPAENTYLNYANFYSLPQAQILFKLNTPSQKRAN